MLFNNGLLLLVYYVCFHTPFGTTCSGWQALSELTLPTSTIDQETALQTLPTEKPYRSIYQLKVSLPYDTNLGQTDMKLTMTGV